MQPDQIQAEPQSAADVSAESRPSRRRTVGQLLRETREGLGSDLNRVATALRIRAAYLEAIEEGRYDNLPGAVYALGFVRAYATHLGLDGEEAVRRFKLEAEGFEGQRDLTFPIPLAERSIPGGTMMLVAVILAICGYGLWYYLSSSARPRAERVVAVPVELALPKAPAAPAPAPVAEVTAPSSEPLPPPPAVVPPVPAAAPVPAETAAPAGEPATATTLPIPLPETSPATARPAPPPENPPPAPSAAAVPAPSAAPPPTAAPAATPPATPEAVAAPPPEKPRIYGVANGQTRITVRALAESSIQVRDQNNATIFARQLHPGDSYRVPDEPGLTMSTGAGTRLAITVDNLPAVPIRRGKIPNVVLDPTRLLIGTAVAPE
ncbi:MAG TPA: RodZ domain-containing protein [Stellaceae bacterium]